MNTELLLACWGMMTLMVLVPGPDWAYIIDAGVRDRTIVPSLGGILVGYLVAVAAVAVGVGAAVAALPWFLVGLTFAAAVYLTYLGIRVLRQPPELAAAGAGGHGDALALDAAPTATAVAPPRPGCRGQRAEPEGPAGAGRAAAPVHRRGGRLADPGAAGRARPHFRRELCPCLLRRRHGSENGAAGSAVGDPHPLAGLGSRDGRARGRARRRTGHASRRRVSTDGCARSRAASGGFAVRGHNFAACAVFTDDSDRGRCNPPAGRLT